MPLTTSPSPLVHLRPPFPPGRFRAPHLPALALIGLGVCLAGTGHAQLSFAPGTQYAAGPAPRAVALGDLDGDQRPDLVVANSGANTLTVRINQGNGTFGPGTSFPTGLNPVHVALSDLDADGKLDAVVANQGQGDNTVSLFFGDGAGSFAPRVNLPAGVFPTFVAIGDLGHEGRPDIVVADNGVSEIRVLINQGGRAFAPGVPYALGGLPVTAAIGEVNGDGNADVVTAGNNSFAYLFPGNGNGGLLNWTGISVASPPTAIAIADVNRDGKQDLALALYGINRLAVLPGNGNGTFGTPALYATGTSPVALAISDLSGDGWIDAAVANFNTANVSILHGNGQGALTSLATVPTQLNPVSVASADVNGDGLPDLATANLGANSVSVILQTPSPPMIRISPTSLAFGPVAIGMTRTLTVRVQNIGSQPLTITGASANGPEYSVLDAIPFVLTRGQLRDLQVRFVPTVPGSFSRTLTISSNDATRPTVTVSLSGSADYAPDVAVTPGSLSLTALSGGGDSAVFEISNNGEGLLQYALLTVGPRPAWLTNEPGAGSVGPGEAQQVTVLATSAGLIGGIYNTTLRVSSNDPDQPQIDVPITFRVIGAARIAVTPPSLDYGSGYVNAAQTLNLIVRNTGNEALVVYSVASGSSEFATSVATPFSVAAFGSVTVPITYRRLVEGSSSATLTIEHSDPTVAAVTVPMSGSAADPPHIVVAPPALQRVIVGVGDSLLQPLTISNTSHGTALTVQLVIAPVPGLSATPPFGVSPASATIAAGGSLPFQVAFRGVNRPGQDLASTLSISSNDPAIPLVQRALALHVRGTAEISVAPNPLNFGFGYTGVPDTRALVISNIGNDTLIVSSAVTSDPEFTITETLPFIVNAGAARDLHVRYARTLVGDPVAHLTLSSNDAAHPTSDVVLLGSTGDPPVVRLSPTSIQIGLAVGDSTVVPLSIRNEGQAILEFTITPRRPPPAPLSSVEGGAEEVLSTEDPDPEAARVPPTDTQPVIRDAGPHALLATRILVIGDGGTENDVVPILSGAGYPVVVVADDAVWNGTNPSPDGFSAVVLLDGIDFGDDMPTAGQQALVDFARGGGGVVITEWISYEVSQGRYASLQPLVPITRTTGLTAVLNYSVVAAHPVTEGVSPTFQVTAAVTKGTLNSGTAVVSLSTGEPAVVVKEEGVGRVVEFAVAGNYNGRRPFLSADMRRLLLNSVSWAAGFRWLSYDPRAGAIPGGAKGIVNVKITTAGLVPGIENVELVVDSNDPTTPRVVVPLRLTVFGGPTPVLASLVRQEAEADRVRVVWHVAGADLPRATVYRSRAGEGWHALREVEADGSGFIEFEDRDVSPGESYGYRLGLSEAGRESMAGETWVAVPAAAFALHRVWPTPSAGDLTVSLSLPDRRGGRIELFDVHGRRWMELPLDRLGPGRHDVSLDSRGVAPPGIYWVRVTSGPRSLTARAILLQ